jgi:hypothetical protein
MALKKRPKKYVVPYSRKKDELNEKWREKAWRDQCSYYRKLISK